jgi:hypothetical protein
MIALEIENKILKLLLKDGIFYVNYWSTDCDGCSASNNTKFTSLEDFDKWIDNTNEWSDGTWGWELTDKNNLEYSEPAGYWGM